MSDKVDAVRGIVAFVPIRLFPTKQLLDGINQLLHRADVALHLLRFRGMRPVLCPAFGFNQFCQVGGRILAYMGDRLQ